jgi:hypothetical protein
MNQNLPVSLLRYFLFCLLFALGLNVNAQTQTYTYDALGRITFVNDSVNGNLDYDYDKAGNRLVVAEDADSDLATEPGAPPTPTGAIYTPCCALNVYRISWNYAPTATYYVVRFTQNLSPFPQEMTTSQLSMTPTLSPNSLPKWVKACNEISCSSKVYFSPPNTAPPSTSSIPAASSVSSSSVASLPVPSAPTNAAYVSCCALNTYRVSWNATSTATYYLVGFTNNPQMNVTQTTITPTLSPNSLPRWVQACNATGCSTKVYF